MTPDMVNGLFELFGALVLSLNVRRIVQDRQLKGVSIWPVVFFALWGFWNLYFYPSVGAFWSFYGGIAVVFVNTLWLILVFANKYRS
jgi:hypothetical protein